MLFLSRKAFIPSVKIDFTTSIILGKNLFEESPKKPYLGRPGHFMLCVTYSEKKRKPSGG